MSCLHLDIYAKMVIPAVVLCSLLFSSLCSAKIVFIDSSTNSYLQPSSDAPVKLEKEALSSVITALSGMFPPYVVDEAAFKAVSAPAAQFIISARNLRFLRVVELTCWHLGILHRLVSW